MWSRSMQEGPCTLCMRACPENSSAAQGSSDIWGQACQSSFQVTLGQTLVLVGLSTRSGLATLSPGTFPLKMRRGSREEARGQGAAIGFLPCPLPSPGKRIHPQVSEVVKTGVDAVHTWVAGHVQGVAQISQLRCTREDRD